MSKIGVMLIDIVEKIGYYMGKIKLDIFLFYNIFILIVIKLILV